ncbi:MAG TPA: alanine--tRNA ligase [Candidatus Binataceae bacterium]|nr:alanine--tRNA ligase [Candidatus Binataceae bacterium]
MRWTTDKIRQSFLDFFAVRGHQVVPSASLIPKGDPTLLFVNAGMVPFKDYFLGVRTAPNARVVDCQKCLRISGKHNDLEAVGRDSYHHTFFEMLGNWSFGDYYKAEAIAFHWELVTKVWEIPAERLWATIYKDDDEAEDAWLRLKVLPKDRILRFGEKDNFWEMGETGPCGPCSEIHIDREPERGYPIEHPGKACDQKAHPGTHCAVNVDGCSRFIELGNLVFIQYNRDAAGKLTPLPMKHVDTGTGLERVAAVLQSLETGKYLGNYDIDLFQKIIADIRKAVWLAGGQDYGQSAMLDISYRAIADHARAISFLIADGLRPGNNDREYVLRRLIRRAVAHGQKLGLKPSFLPLVCAGGVVDVEGSDTTFGGVVGAMRAAYPDLGQQVVQIQIVTTEEGTRFGDTLDRGLETLKAEVYNVQMEYINAGTKGLPVAAALALKGMRRDEVVSRKVKLTLPDEVAFKLYDTYGFPLDLTQDVLREQGISVDVAGFDVLMEEQRVRSRIVRRGLQGIASGSAQFDHESPASRFVGEHRYEAESEVLLFQSIGDIHQLVVAETPFYPEGGGQAGDRGVIETESGAIFEVIDTKKSGRTILHVGRMLRGDHSDFLNRARVKLRIDRERRDASMLNHSATHILHYALRDILSKDVHQAGSMVAPERLRFDFSHNGPVAAGDLATIEEEINARIRENAEVVTEEMAYDDALKAGALAFFGDKYGDVVRVVRMGDFSTELCGGTHVQRTGDVGLFKLESEGGVAAGVRRIEAFTGQGALDAIRRREKILEDIGGQLGARDGAAVERLEKLLAREKELEKKLRTLEQKLVNGATIGGADAEKVREVNGVKIVTRKVEGVEAKSLREMADRLRQKYGSAVVAIGSDLGDNKAALLVAVTADLAKRIKAGDIVKEIAPIIGGTGGGRPDFAQAGGRDASKLDEALERIAILV